MIIEKKEQHHAITGNEHFLTIESKVNKNKLAKLYGMLSNIYRNPINAIVREYASNGYDANIEAHNFKKLSWSEIQVKYPWVLDPTFKMDEKSFIKLKSNLTKASLDEPVLIGVTQDTSGQDIFYVKDYGIGLSEERMMNIYFNYLDTTKSDTDDELGGFGIGAKSALAYTHTFFIETVYDKVKYNYIMTKSAHGIPQGQLLTKFATTEDNGTLIKIPLKDDDISIFKSAIIGTLCYMPNAYYEEKLYDDNIDWNYTLPSFNENHIIDKGEWIVSTEFARNNKSRTLHISLDNIPYDIDWSELGIIPIHIPIALKFTNKELKPVPSRESILYTKEAVEVIKKKIEVFKDYFRDYLKTKSQETDDIVHYLDHRYENIDNYGIKFKSSTLLTIDMKLLLGRPNYDDNYSPLTFKPYGKWNDHFRRHVKYFDTPYTYTGEYKNGKYKGSDYTNSASYSSLKWRDHVVSIPYNVKISSIKAANIHNKYVGPDKMSTCVEYYRYKKWTLKEYVKNLKLSMISKSDWRTVIKLYQDTFEEYWFNKMINYEKELLNPNWAKFYSAGKTPYKDPYSSYASTMIRVRGMGESYGGSPSVHNGSYKDLTMSNFIKDIATGDIIYFLKDEVNFAKELYILMNKNDGVIKYTVTSVLNGKHPDFIFVQINKKDEKIFKNYNKAYSVKEVLELKMTHRNKAIIKKVNKVYERRIVGANLKSNFFPLEGMLKKDSTYKNNRIIQKLYDIKRSSIPSYFDGISDLFEMLNSMGAIKEDIRGHVNYVAGLKFKNPVLARSISRTLSQKRDYQNIDVYTALYIYDVAQLLKSKGFEIVDQFNCERFEFYLRFFIYTAQNSANVFENAGPEGITIYEQYYND